MRAEIRRDRGFGVESVQSVGTVVRSEYGARKGAVGVGQSHQHELAARPDVQGVCLHLELAVSRGTHLNFLVAVGQIPLGKIKTVRAHQPVPDRTERPVCPEDPVKRLRVCLVPAVVQRQFVGLQIDVDAAVVKPVGDLCVFLRFFHQQAVEQGPRDRVNALRIVKFPLRFWQAVRLACEGAVRSVHGAVGDGKGDFTDRASDAGFLEGAPSPVAQGEVDAAASFVRSGPWVRSAFEHVNMVPALREHQRPKAPHQAGADYGHFLRRQSVFFGCGHAVLSGRWLRWLGANRQ